MPPLELLRCEPADGLGDNLHRFGLGGGKQRDRRLRPAGVRNPVHNHRLDFGQPGLQG